MTRFKQFKGNRPSIVFVCSRNTGRCQMAQAYLRAFAGDTVDVGCAGRLVSESPDPAVIDAMAEDGIDISRFPQAKTFARNLTDEADYIIAMGPDVKGITNAHENWELADPKAQPLERVRDIRDQIKRKTLALAKRLATDLD